MTTAERTKESRQAGRTTFILVFVVGDLVQESGSERVIFPVNSRLDSEEKRSMLLLCLLGLLTLPRSWALTTCPLLNESSSWASFPAASCFLQPQRLNITSSNYSLDLGGRGKRDFRFLLNFLTVLNCLGGAGVVVFGSLKLTKYFFSILNLINLFSSGSFTNCTGTQLDGGALSVTGNLTITKVLFENNSAAGDGN